MVGMSQNLQSSLAQQQPHPGHHHHHPHSQQPHLAYMQAQLNSQEQNERMKASTKLNQQYQSEHLHNSYYHQQQQKMIHSFHQ